MNEHEQALLQHNIIVLPEVISHETYVKMLDLLTRLKGREVRLYCTGDGGDAVAALAISDLIEQHGNVVGLLPSTAASSNAIIFCSCQRRYVYPRGTIALHKVAWEGLDTRVDSTALHLLAESYDATERHNADILARASNQPADYWYELYQRTGSAGLFELNAESMIAMGIARPISEYTPDEPANPNDSPPVQDGGRGCCHADRRIAKSTAAGVAAGA